MRAVRVSAGLRGYLLGAGGGWRRLGGILKSRNALMVKREKTHIRQMQRNSQIFVLQHFGNRVQTEKMGALRSPLP